MDRLPPARGRNGALKRALARIGYIPEMTRLRLAVILSTACVLVPVARAQALDARATSRAFYAAFASGDERAVAGAWAPAAPEELRRRARWTMRARCMRLLALDIVAMETDAHTARVSVEALLARRARNGADAVEPLDGVLTLARSGGRWKVVQWTLREELLAGAIAAAPDAAAPLRDTERRGGVPLLNRLLARHALAVINNGDDARGAAIATLMKRMARESGDLAGESLAFSIDSIVLNHERDPAAIEAGRTSLALAEQSGDPDALAKALLRLGRAEAGDSPGMARGDRFERVLALADDLEDPLPAGTAASRLAALYAARRDHRRAFYYAVLAREIAERNGDTLTSSAAELNLAGEYEYDGDVQLAREHFRKALEMGRRAGYRKNELSIMAHLASLEQRLGHEAAFRRLRAEVLRRAGAEGADEAISEIYDNDLTAALDRGQLARAERIARRAIDYAPPHSFYRYRAWIGLGGVHLRQHKPRAAIEDVAQARAVAPTEGFDAALVTAEALRQLGRIDEATAAMRRAVSEAEVDRAAIVADDRQRRMILKERLGPYLGLVDLLVAQKQPREALFVAERAKGRALLDMLSGAEVRLPAMSDEERRTERELAARVSRLEAGDGAELELDSYRTQLRAKYTPFSAAAAPAELAETELRALLPDRHIAFVEYVVTKSRLHIFVVRRDASGVAIRVRTVAVASADLEPAVRRFRDALAGGDLRFEAPARALYARLLTPVERDLRGVTTLCLVPDGALWHVPFEALIGPRGEVVTARMATFYAPSIAVYAAMRRGGGRRRAAPSLLAFADPRAADAEREVLAAAACCPRHTIYLGADALESRVKRESGGYDIIHFATHGVIDDANPMYSHLLLVPDGEEDGVLETWEMLRLDLHAELVVLSACDTARGKVGAGEGLIGMSWALFAAGSPSTIATQWKVDSATAADLTIAFYRQWRGGGEVSKARALQRARAAIRRDPRRRHPFFWASYVLIGLGG